MKHYLILILSLVFCLPMAAQRPQNPDVQERFFEAKAKEMCERLQLTAEQKEKFLPIYKAYDEEMRKTWTKYRVEKDSKNSVERTKMRLKRQEKLQEIRLKYLDKFSKVLSGNQVENFYKVENDIQERAKRAKESHRRGEKKAYGEHRGQRSNKGQHRQ